MKRSLVPYREDESWGLLTDFQDEMNRLFGSWFGKFPSIRSTLGKRAFTPSADVWEDNNNIYVEADLPGMEQKDINVNVKGNTLVISAKREEAKEEKKKNYFRSERFEGNFYRAMDLLSAVDASKIKANYKNGVLKIVLPKKEGEKGKEIKINVE